MYKKKKKMFLILYREILIWLHPWSLVLLIKRAAHRPTLSAPRSESVFRIWWKYPARSRRGVFHRRWNSSACRKTHLCVWSDCLLSVCECCICICTCSPALRLHRSYSLICPNKLLSIYIYIMMIIVIATFHKNNYLNYYCYICVPTEIVI